MSEARTNGKRPSCTRHDKSGTEAVEKNMECVSAKMAVRQSKSPSFYFSTDLIWLMAMRVFFSFAGAELLA